jgi:hypothetical protein
MDHDYFWNWFPVEFAFEKLFSQLIPNAVLRFYAFKKCNFFATLIFLSIFNIYLIYN